MKLTKYLCKSRLSRSKYSQRDALEEYMSDHSRIVFSSSFRRLAKKAQVFPLESNTSVRNRLTHSLEVADVGRTIARSVSLALHKRKQLSDTEVPCIISIVENACLLHDLGNPPFGHFGEEAIKKWFTQRQGEFPDGVDENDVYDFLQFDGNPQGFRIATRLHHDRDEFSLNLTCATLLASIKYPHCRKPEAGKFNKKIGYFSSEQDRYDEICDLADHAPGTRYFLAYLMELADDICYCLSDIADSFEKKIVTVSEYTDWMSGICKKNEVDTSLLACEECADDFDFRFNVAIPLAKQIITEATSYFVDNLEGFLSGEAEELAKSIKAAGCLRCLKDFARRHIYTALEVERIELSGFHIVNTLLDQFGKLLDIAERDFQAFVNNDRNLVPEQFVEWRLFNRLSKRMRKAYKHTRSELPPGDKAEWLARAHLIVDFISGMTDESAKELHQILTGTDSLSGQTAW